MNSQLQDCLRILHLEDNPLDAELIRETLERQGILANIVSVDTETEFRAALQNGNVDLVLSDYSLPGFGGMGALEIVNELRPDLPFIFVSGTIGEDIAIESLKSGATDYVLKQRLERLGLSVRRALREVEELEKSTRKDEALRDSEARYKLLFERNPLSMWVFDRETFAFLAVNEAAIQRYGYSREEFLAMTVMDIRPPEDAAAFIENVAQSHKGLTRNGIWRHRKKDGTIIHVEITSHAIEFLNQKAELVLANDVSERHRAEAVLHETNQTLQTFIRASPLAILALDMDRKVRLWNPEAERIFGWTESEVIGRVLPTILEEDLHGQLALRDQFLSSEGFPPASNLETRRVRKDGSIIQVSVSFAPLRDEQGAINGTIGIIADITERQLIEEARQSSELRYRRLFESAKDGILILDADNGQIVDANPYLIEMVGRPKEELVGKELWEIGLFKDIVASKQAFAALQQQGYIRYDNLPLENRAGLARHVEFVSNRYRVGDTNVIQCNIRDITDRKLAEEEVRLTNQRLKGALEELQKKTEELASMTQQLWQASKLATMGELAASIAHELNNPLATVGLRAESILEQLDENDPNRRGLQVISQEVERMGNLVGNLLQFSRRSHQQTSTVDLREELNSSLDLTHYHLRSNRINIIKDFDPDLPTVQADRQQLRQVFLNLLTNASDAMPHGGSLTVRAKPAMLDGKNAALMEISDSGLGIDEDDLSRLWEPFFTTKPEGKGTGLGLPICRRTIEEHRGVISIATRRGEGTTVSILLPATEQDQPQHKGAAANPAGHNR